MKLLMDTHPPFDDERFVIYKARTQIFIEAIDFELYIFFINGLFVPTILVNNELVNKMINLWTVEDKREIKLGFNVKYLIMSALNAREYFYVFNYNTANEVCNNLEIINKGFPEINPETSNMPIQEDHLDVWFLK